MVQGAPELDAAAAAPPAPWVPLLAVPPVPAVTVMVTALFVQLRSVLA
jgi:hypothetical protein